MSRYYDTRLKISRFRREPLIRLKVRRGLPLGERIPFARLSFWDRTRRNSGRRVRGIFFLRATEIYAERTSLDGDLNARRRVFDCRSRD
jgi:hypothetical protein